MGRKMGERMEEEMRWFDTTILIIEKSHPSV
jgi:hypothetical protein